VEIHGEVRPTGASRKRGNHQVPGGVKLGITLVTCLPEEIPLSISQVVQTWLLLPIGATDRRLQGGASPAHGRVTHMARSVLPTPLPSLVAQRIGSSPGSAVYIRMQQVACHDVSLDPFVSGNKAFMAPPHQPTRVVSGMSAPSGEISCWRYKEDDRQTRRLKYEASRLRACHACPDGRLGAGSCTIRFASGRQDS